MNESELEAELLSLAPAAPRPELENRIAAELHGLSVPARPVTPAAGTIARPVERRSRGWFAFLPNLGWACAGALTGVAALIALKNPGSPASLQSVRTSGASALAAAESLFEPLEAAREVVAEDEPEIFYDDERGPSQVLRTSSLEHYTWTNPSTGARVEVEMPREDVLFLPVSYQ
jgi:hypothetical protein